VSGASNISWTNDTWNPVRGCSRVSEGCRKCYAEVLAARHSYPGGWGEGLATWVKRPDGTQEARWTGQVRTIDSALDYPLKRRAPSRIFVNSMSDLFHEDLPDSFIDKVFAVMESVGGGRHKFQVLTKRADRLRTYVTRRWSGGPVPAVMRSNIWLGVSAEDQAEFDERVPELLATPAAVRWVSIEPLLGHVDLVGKDMQGSALHPYRGRPRLNWGVVGGESGSGYRHMSIDAARYVIRQFSDAEVPLFVKQDHGPRPGMQGRFTAEEWALKEYPA
jgi:protein gp37